MWETGLPWISDWLYNLDVGQLATPQPCISLLRQSGISAAQYIWAGQGRAGMEFKKSQMIYGISYKLFSLCPTVKYTISYRDREMLTAMLFWLEICRRRWSEQLLHLHVHIVFIFYMCCKVDLCCVVWSNIVQSSQLTAMEKNGGKKKKKSKYEKFYFESCK